MSGAQAAAKLAVQLFARSFHAEKRLKTGLFDLGRGRPLLQFTRNNGKGIGRNAAMKGRAPRKLGEGVLFEELADGGDEFGG
jgi:hypothetical protein